MGRVGALLGDRVFLTTDDAHLVCLDRLTGAVRWDVFTAEEPQRYGGTGAPLVVIGHNDHIAWGFTNNGADVQDVYI